MSPMLFTKRAQQCTARVQITARGECVPAECLLVAGGAFRDGDNDCAAAVDTDTLTGHPSIHLSIDGIPLDLLLLFLVSCLLGKDLVAIRSIDNE